MNNLKNVFPSGHGQIRVSAGAEDFDPESLLDGIPEAQAVDLSSQPYPILKLNFLRPNSEKVAIGGLLRKTSCTSFYFQMTFECLVSVALDFVQEPWSVSQMEVESCLIESAGNETDIFLSGCKIESMTIEECMGKKALVRLQFEKPKQ